METPEEQPLIAQAAGDIPGDLVAVAAASLATILCVYVPILNETFLRIVFGVAMVLFIPGYALIAAGAVADEARAGEFIRGGAPDSVTLWEVSGADHTGGLRTEPDEWEQRVVAFLDGALDPT